VHPLFLHCFVHYNTQPLIGLNMTITQHVVVTVVGLLPGSVTSSVRSSSVQFSTESVRRRRSQVSQRTVSRKGLTLYDVGLLCRVIIKPVGRVG